MSEFLLLHGNESGGKPATVRKKYYFLQFFHQKIIQKDQLSLLNLMMEKL